jgi:hypothetical protein
LMLYGAARILWMRNLLFIGDMDYIGAVLEHGS